MIKKISHYSFCLLLSFVSISSYSGTSRLAQAPDNFKNLIPSDTYIFGLNGKVKKYTITRNSGRKSKSKTVYIFDKRGYVVSRNTFKSGRPYLSVTRISAVFNKNSAKLKYKQIYYKNRPSARKVVQQKLVIWKRKPNNDWKRSVTTEKSMSPTEIIDIFASDWTPISREISKYRKFRRALYKYNSKRHLITFKISSSLKKKFNRGANISYDYQHNGNQVNAKVTDCTKLNKCSTRSEKTIYSKIDKNKNFLESVHFNLKRPKSKTRTVRTFQYFQ